MKRKPFRLTISLANASDKERTKLKRQQMPGYLYRASPYRLDETIRRFDIKRDAAPPRSMSKATQQDHARSIFKADKPFVACVSSELNDLRAKQFAAYAMLRWMRHADSGISIWHTVTGGLNDSIRDADDLETRRKPSQIILANADYDMLGQKREKLRDLLEMFSDVPRLVTATGTDPINFMNRIGYPCHFCVWVRSAEVWDL